VLASRYASTSMAELWAPESKIRLERQLWIAVMRAQQELGIAIPVGVPEKSKRLLTRSILSQLPSENKLPSTT